MKRLVCVLAAVALVFGLAGILSAQDLAKEREFKAQLEAKVQALEAANALAAQKKVMAKQIVQAREQLQQREPFAQAAVDYWTDRLTGLSVQQLQTIADAGTDAPLEALIASATGTALADTPLPDLGDSSADLVYTKVAPCRVADTRVAGGILGTGATRTFYIAGTSGFAAQGGTACGIPLGSATAVAMNVTMVGASGPGWLRAYPYGGSGNASIINYSSGQTIANGLVMPICDPATTTCTKDLTVVADSYGGHVLIDVMGYWAKVNKGQYRTLVAEAYTAATTAYPESGCASYESVTITTPVAGKVVVMAHNISYVSHVTGTTDWYWFGINTTSTSCSFTLGEGGYFLVPGALPSASYRYNDTVFNVYSYTLPGTYTYYLNGYKSSGSATGYFYYAGMTATFYPQ